MMTNHSANASWRPSANTSHSTRRILPRTATWYTFTLSIVTVPIIIIVIIAIIAMIAIIVIKSRLDLTLAPPARDSAMFAFFTGAASFSIRLALGYNDDGGDDDDDDDNDGKEIHSAGEKEMQNAGLLDWTAKRQVG